MPTLKPLHYLTLAGALTLGAGGASVVRGQLAPPPPAKGATVEVKHEDLRATVSATGSVASPAQSKLSFKSGGRLAELLVGDDVVPGQPLQKFDIERQREILAELIERVEPIRAEREQRRGLPFSHTAKIDWTPQGKALGAVAVAVGAAA